MTSEVGEPVIDAIAVARLQPPSPATNSEPATIATLRLPRRTVLVLRITVGLAVGGVLLLLFVRLVRFSAVSHRLTHLNVALAALCGAVFLSAYAVRAMRWRHFLEPDHVGARRAIAIYFIAIFLNWLLPVQGGELAKSIILRRTDRIPVSRSLPAVGIDKAMDLLPAALLVAIIPFTPLRLSRTLWVLLAVASLSLVGGILALVLASWRHDRTLAWLLRLIRAVVPVRIESRAGPFVADFVDRLLTFARRPRLLAIATCYTAVAVGLDGLFCFLAFRAVGAAVSFPIVLFGYTLYNLAYILPTPPAHLGSNELVGLLIFSGVFGISRTSVGAMFVFSHPWTAFLMTTSGLLCLRGVGLSMGAILKTGRSVEPGGDG